MSAAAAESTAAPVAPAETAKKGRNHVRFIIALAVVSLVLMIPPLVLEIFLYQSASAVGTQMHVTATQTLMNALAAENAGALLYLRTVGSDTLTPFQRSASYVTAQRNTNAALADLATIAAAADAIRELAVKLTEPRVMVFRDGAVSLLTVEAKYAAINTLAATLPLRLLAATSPAVSTRIARAAAISDAAAAWSRAASLLNAAVESPTQRLASTADYASLTGAVADAKLAVAHVNALRPSAATAENIDYTRTVSSHSTKTVDFITRSALSSVTVAGTTSIAIPTSALTDGTGQRLSAEASDAMVKAGAVVPSTSIELAQLIVTIGACACAVAALACVAYAVYSGIASSDTGSARDLAITHMDTAYKRVLILMERILRFESNIPAHVVEGPALSPVEAELRGLLKPMARVIAHVPRSALARPISSPPDEDPLVELDSEASLRHNVTIMAIDMAFVDDAAVSGDVAKTLPGRVSRFRAMVMNEVQRRGGVPVLSPLNRWIFAWNITGHDKSGIQSATHCAMSIIGTGAVDYPSLRCVVLTGSVAIGSCGTSTLRTEIVAGVPMMLIPVALRVARSHGSQLVVDSDTYAHSSSQAYRARPVEVVGADDTTQGTVLYDMLSNLDSHDQRLLQWCEAFEKYHAGAAKEALAAMRAWSKEGSDRTVTRLISLLESTPPRTVTIGEAKMEAFTKVASN